MDAELFTKLNQNQMKKVINILGTEANRRISEFEKAGETSPALRSVEKSGGRFSSANKKLNALRSEFIRAKNFLESRTGTVAKYDALKDEVIDTLESDYAIFLAKEDWHDLWDYYEKVKELNKTAKHAEIKYKIINVINNMIIEGKKSGDDIVTEVAKKATKMYEDYMEEERKKPSVSSFFEI